MFFIKLSFLFAIGSICGWVIEVFYRRFFSTGHWVNPGYLSGPYLPLYGFSLVILYLLAGLESYIPIEQAWLRKALLFLLMAFAITALEFVAGMIFIHGMKVQLWDYSNHWGNIKGVICPKYSFFWIILSALYYFLIHPHILSALEWLSNNLAFSFGIGFFYGIFVIDLVYSTQLMARIRQFAKESQIVVRIEELRESIRTSKDRTQEKKRYQFFFPFRSINLKESLEKYRDTYNESKKNLQEFIQEKKEEKNNKDKEESNT